VTGGGFIQIGFKSFYLDLVRPEKKIFLYSL